MSKNFIITNDNVREYAKKIGEWIKNKVNEAGTEGVVLGMSGGVDCSTVAMLCKNAGIKVHLVILPYGEHMKNSNTYSNELAYKYI